MIRIFDQNLLTHYIMIYQYADSFNLQKSLKMFKHCLRYTAKIWQIKNINATKML